MSLFQEELFRNSYFVLNYGLELLFLFLKAWWWALLPFLLIKPFLFLWLWWRQELSHKAQEYAFLEVKIPMETIKPIKAMADTFASLIGIDVAPGDFREKWIEGGSTLYPPLSFEIAGIDGQAHFLVRVIASQRHTLEAAIYSHYPYVEIQEVKDYTKAVPSNIPNDQWDLESRDYVLKNESCYPLRTYQDFEIVEGLKEEKRVDPLAGLLEAFSFLKKGEQVWFQFLLHPATKDWIEKGGKERDKLAKRPGEKPPPKPIILEILEFFLSFLTAPLAPAAEKKEEKKELLPPEMMLTPGERQKLAKLEEKITRPGFDTSLRVLYVAKKEVFFKGHFGAALSFLKKFDTKDLNFLSALAETSTKVHSTFLWFLDKRRMFLRKRQIFRNYLMRVRPFFPRQGKLSVLSIDELASLIHFPGRTVAPAPSLVRIEARKEKAPSTLPTGE